MSLSEYELAIAELEKIEQEWSYDILSDDALYLQAQIFDNKLQEKEKAMLLYERILLEHNSSIFVSEARKRFRILRGDNFKTEE